MVFTSELIRTVLVELSNRCPHVHIHKSSCPLSEAGEPTYLRTDAILRIFDQLGVWDYDRDVCLSNYNEPCVDPRLFMLMDELHKRVPKVHMYMWTSSWWMNEYLMHQLREHGLTDLRVNGYVESERKRMETWNIPAGMKFTVRNGGHDNRISMYTQSKEEYPGRKCTAPYRELTIHCTGDVGMCCMDWKRSVTFGNLYEKPLLEILGSPRMMETAVRNQQRGRNLPVCVRCVKGEC